VQFVRFHSPHPNARGTFPGVFALANGLRSDGRLSDADVDWLRAANTTATLAYADPSVTHPEVYDRALHPTAEAWFRVSALHLTEMVRGYLELLARYGVACVESRSDDPGEVIYSDDVQVVVVPFRSRPNR